MKNECVWTRSVLPPAWRDTRKASYRPTRSGLCPKPCPWRKSPPSKPKSWPRNDRRSKRTWTTTSP
uniref:Uncharacterized protein n=1 Tax=Anguilla anguilla TaxID=7936 RepID=A0A0E9QTM5_ANGAN